MKILISLLIFFSISSVVLAATQYEFEPGVPGSTNGSLNILEDVSSLTFRTDFGSVGNSGSVGYYVYTTDPAAAVDGSLSFTKPDGQIVLPALKAGEKVGFYLTRANQRKLTLFNFVEDKKGLYLDFYKNGGAGKSERMLLVPVSSEQKPSGPSGQPLPGVLATLAVGLTALGVRRRLRRRRDNAK